MVSFWHIPPCCPGSLAGNEQRVTILMEEAADNETPTVANEHLKCLEMSCSWQFGTSAFWCEHAGKTMSPACQSRHPTQHMPPAMIRRRREILGHDMIV